MDKLYYIQNGWVGNAMCWWGKNRRGYTCNIKNAGKYTEEEMLEITERVSDKGWPCDYIDNAEEALVLTVDSQYLDHKESVNGTE